MDGRCFVCSSKFTLFNREYCCALCKHSACSKCLTEIVVKKLGPNKQKVCLECKRSQECKEDSPDVPLELPKFLQSAADSPGSAAGPAKPKLQRQITDDDIQARLNALKGNKPANKVLGKRMSEYELQSKVNKMMGRPPPVREPVIHLYVDVKPVSDQVDDLVTQVDDECQIDKSTEGTAKPTGIEDLEARVNALKSGTDKLLASDASAQKPADGGLRDLSHLTEAEQVEYILRQAQEEAKLDLRAGLDYQPTIAPKADTPEEEELPWCCVCNADAEVRCAQCDNDLYCKRCYKEGHSEFDLDDHQPTPFKKTQKHTKYEMEQ